MLNALGCEVMLEADAESAFELLLEDNYAGMDEYDILIVNIRQNGGMDGVMFTKMVRDVEKRRGDTSKVIIGVDQPTVSYDMLEKDRKILQEQDVNDFYYKPIVKSDLRWILQRYLRNSGLILLDLVVTYTPEGETGAFEDYMKKRAKRERNILRNENSNVVTSLKGALSNVRSKIYDSVNPKLDGLIELRISTAILKETVEENWRLTWVVSLNHQVVESLHPIVAINSVLMRNELIPIEEDIRLWVKSNGNSGEQPPSLSISLYAYPPGAKTWNSENLIGRWASNDADEPFWPTVNGKYGRHICPLMKNDEKQKKRRRGIVEINCIVRPSIELAYREIHDAFTQAKNEEGVVGRGDIDKLTSLFQPLIVSDRQVQEWNKVRGLYNDSDEEYDSEDSDAQMTDHPKHFDYSLDRMDRFTLNSAHYTQNGQAGLTELMVSQMLDLHAQSQI